MALSRVCWIDSSGRLRCPAMRADRFAPPDLGAEVTKRLMELAGGSNPRFELIRQLIGVVVASDEPSAEASDAVVSAAAGLLAEPLGYATLTSVHFVNKADCSESTSSEAPAQAS